MASEWGRRIRSPEGALSLLVVAVVLFSALALLRLDPGAGPAQARFEAGPGRVTAVEVQLRSVWTDWEIRVAAPVSLKASLSTPATAASTNVTGPIHPTGLLAPGAFVSFCSVEGPTQATVAVLDRRAAASASAAAAAPFFSAQLEVPAC